VVGRIIADLDTRLIREMEEVKRIASTSRNLKETYIRRLWWASLKASAEGAELQQRTIFWGPS
jgi:hypothetical protein